MKHEGTRSYDSSFRQQQQAETRLALVEAAMKRLYDVEPGDLSYADLADDVGVSPRTVYRHFPARDDLLIAVADHFASLLGVADAMPTDLPSLLEAARRVGRYLDRNPRAYRLFFRTPGFSRSGGHERMRMIFDDPLDGLSDDQKRAAGAVLTLLTSPYAWDTLHDWGLTTDAALGAVELAIEAFLTVAHQQPERLFTSPEES